MPTIALFALTTLLLSGNALAEIYKCEAGKNRTLYSDKPCSETHTQSLVDVPKQAAQASDNSDVIRRLGDAVKNAIRNNDLRRAEALASTDEQKNWVADAKKEAAKNNIVAKAETDTAVDKANSAECLAAQRSLEKDTRSNFMDPAILSSRTSLMRAKCGIKEPEPSYINRYPYLTAWPNKPGHINPPQGITTGPYDRHMEKPFGSRFIRPEN